MVSVRVVVMVRAGVRMSVRVRARARVRVRVVVIVRTGVRATCARSNVSLRQLSTSSNRFMVFSNTQACDSSVKRKTTCLWGVG